jgi:hypothetical protein
MDLENKITHPQGAGELLQKEIFMEELERERENLERERRFANLPLPKEKKRRRKKEVKKIDDTTGFGGY